MVASEVKLISAVGGLYTAFLYWGFLQEKITSQTYVSPTDSNVTGKWHFSFVLNACMATAGALTGLLMLAVTGQLKGNPPLSQFWRPAMSCTLASPLGYLSLQYINYPLLLLAKSCKLVPVMLMGVVMLGRRHTREEYLSVFLITVGVALFSLDAESLRESFEGGGGGAGTKLLGLGLVSVVMGNLLLDGVTNAEQDKINSRLRVSSFFMMLAINVWILLFHIVYLLLGAWVYTDESELMQAWRFCAAFPEVVTNVAAFCTSAGIGQLFVFFIIKEFGSLTNVTVTISRKFFSILISVVQFGHVVVWWQWVGILCVFLGLSLSVAVKYRADQGDRGKGKVKGQGNARQKEA
ncbi:unnamed protein product [Discosporangium mesarthrocarpum]